MKVAIISDIHANISALTAVLDDIKKRECEAVFCLGDYIGYYYWPNEVLDALRSLDVAYFIKGNHEEFYFESLVNSDFRKSIKDKYGNGIECAIRQISKENLCFLRSLSETVKVEFSGVRFSMYHGSPSRIDEYVYPDASIERFMSIAEAEADVVLLGHTHYQYSVYTNGCLIINPGSVGQARDCRGRASYSILNLQNMVVLPIRLDYCALGITEEIDKLEENKNREKMKKAVIGGSKGCV